MSENQPQKNWTEDLDNLKSLSPSHNKRHIPIKGLNVRGEYKFDSNEAYDMLNKRLTLIEKRIDRLEKSLSLTNIRQIRNKLNQLEGDINGNPSRS
jgi:DNA-binding transcriptional MerR regulator